MHNLVVFIYNSQCSTYWPIEVEVKCVDKHRREERPKRYPTHNQSDKIQQMFLQFSMKFEYLRSFASTAVQKFAMSHFALVIMFACRVLLSLSVQKCIKIQKLYITYRNIFLYYADVPVCICVPLSVCMCMCFRVTHLSAETRRPSSMMEVCMPSQRQYVCSPT